MVIGNSSQQPGLEQDDPSGYRTGQHSDVTGVPPPNVIRVWQEVALGIDRSQTGKRRIVQLRVSALGFLGVSLLKKKFPRAATRSCLDFPSAFCNHS